MTTADVSCVCIYAHNDEQLPIVINVSFESDNY
jgi:hypothetical protein